MTTNSQDGALAQFGREEFADWLSKGLRAFYSQPISERMHAFGILGLLIMQQESLSEGLAHVYEKHVPQPGKLAFRQAIGDVLREQANDGDASPGAFRDLISLLVRIRATESLAALLPAVGNGLAGRRDPDLIYDAIAALELLAPSSHAYFTVCHLVSSVNFDDGYLFEGIKVMAECEPSRIPSIIVEFEPRLSRLRKQAEELSKHDKDEWNAFCEAADSCAQHLLSVGLRSWIGDLCQQSEQMSSPAWLFECLLNNVCSTSTPWRQQDVWTIRRALQHCRSKEAAFQFVHSPVEGLWESISTLLPEQSTQNTATL